jgi:hypothetical protein
MRKIIRDVVKQALMDRPELRTVQIGRRHRINTDQLPAALIYTDTEEVEKISFQPVKYKRDVELLVRFYVRPDGVTAGEDDLDAILDAASELIAEALRPTPGVFDVSPAGLETDGSGEGDADYLMASAKWIVSYISEQ